MKKNELHINIYLKRIVLLSLLMFCIASIYANAELKSNNESSVFYSNEVIFVAKGAVLSVQTEYVEVKKPIVSEGVLHITHKNKVRINAKNNIQLRKLIVENTILVLENELEVKNLELNNADIQLNDFNLFIDEKITLNANSKVIINGIGKTFIGENQNDINNSIDTDFNPTNLKTLWHELKVKQDRVEQRKDNVDKVEINEYNLINNEGPPPKY